MDHFGKEAEFEQNLIAMLQRYGWRRKNFTALRRRI